jgi:hypothetical protein
MYEQRFIVVAERGHGYNTNTFFKLEETAHDVLSLVMEANTQHGDTDKLTIKRIFSVDELGTVTHYTLELKDFQLSLKIVPKEAK